MSYKIAGKILYPRKISNIYAAADLAAFTSVRDYLAELGDIFSLMHLAEPRIEPEIVFRLAAAPVAGMDERTMLESVDWVAHGFEVVQSTGHCQGLPGPGFSFSICA